MTTREKLILSAGKLFAEHGYDSVSTRAIADNAGVKLGSIHYHFGSKESLYLEAFIRAKDNGDSTNFQNVIDENPSLIETPEGQAEIIRSTIFRRFYDYFRKDRPAWETQIIVREIASPSSAQRNLTAKIYKPDNDSAVNFYLVVNPKGSKQEAEAWADLFHAKLFFYIMVKEPLELIRGEGAVDKDFYLVSAKMLSKAMILTLGLPLPADLY